MAIDGHEILALVKKGEMQGFRLLFDRYYALLCGVANGYLNNNQLAEEIVGDVFFKIWENRDSIEIHTSIKAYLLRAVRNRCLNNLEQHKFERTFLRNLSEGACREDIIAADNHTPLTDLMSNELEDAINRTIDGLPAECREIFRLSRFENLKYEEIAQRQNISVNTVKTQMKIALQKLRQALAPYMPAALAASAGLGEYIAAMGK